MAEIVTLKTRQAKVDAAVVALLESYLEQARRGEIIAIAIAGVSPEFATVTGSSGAEAFAPLVGAVAVLQHRMLAVHLG
jgi:hypothetical protein